MRLYVLRHARAQMAPRVASDEWTLSADGIAAARAARDVVATLDVPWVVSPEPKAVETSRYANPRADARLDERLRELARPADLIADYGSVAERALATPTEPAQPGWETAADAAARFAAVVADANEDVGLCTHGLVFSAWVMRSAAANPPGTGFWRALRFPDLWLVDLDPTGRWTTLTRLDLPSPS